MSEKKEGETKLMTTEIESLRRRQAEIAERARVDSEALDKEIEKARKAIMRGKWVTGDHITDFFVGAYGIVDDTEVSKPLRDLEKQMAGKRKQLFLVVRREKEELGPVFRGGPSFIGRLPRFHIKSRHYLGILSDDKLFLDLKGESYGLPTEAYAEVLIGRPSEKKPGPFRFIGTELLKFPDRPEKLTEILWNGCGSEHALEVIVGCDSVLVYSPPEFLVAKPRKRPAHWVIALNQTIRLLGGKIPEAPEEKVAKEEEKKSVLTSLEQKYDAFKIMSRDGRASRKELEDCEKMIRTRLAQTKELGLEGDPLVVLVRAKLGMS